MAYTTINDPSAYFQSLLYTGNSSTQSVTNDGNSDLQPDLVWTKCRSNASNNFVFDSNRGVYIRLFTDDTAAEVSNTNALTAFNSDGFSMGNVGGMNFNSQTYVAWQWKANGGTTSSNTDGSITSTVQANTTSGFSVVTYTGTQANATVGHGLGVAPKFIISKCRSASNGWPIYHYSLTATDFIRLNSTNGTSDNAAVWNDTEPTSTVFSIGANDENNKSSATQLAYCFAEKQGYSKFGSYTGNGSTDGTFVYTGFKPAWTMIKNTQTASYNWVIQDTKRFGEINSGAGDKNLAANSSSAEPSSGSFAGNQIDFLSNGFKLRSTAANTNAAQSYIYMAFAQNPLVATNNTIALAR